MLSKVFKQNYRSFKIKIKVKLKDKYTKKLLSSNSPLRDERIFLTLSTQTVILNCLSHFWRVFVTDGAICRLEQHSLVHHHGGFFCSLSKTVTGSLLNCCSHHGFRSRHAPSSTPPSATVIIPTFTNYSWIISSWINDGSVLRLLFSLLLCFFSSRLLSLVNSNSVE